MPHGRRDRPEVSLLGAYGNKNAHAASQHPPQPGPQRFDPESSKQRPYVGATVLDSLRLGRRAGSGLAQRGRGDM